MQTMLTFLLDPRIFNYLIMSLYLINAGWWGWRRNLGQACYWLSACAITASVTFLMESK